MATETHSSFAYVDFYGRLTVVSSTQTPFHMRRIIGAALGIPISEIRVIKPRVGGGYGGKQQIDRKSTRLNSSHANISYAVFCLKKKKQYRRSLLPSARVI